MKNLKWILLVVISALLIFVAHTLISTGFFRTIEPFIDGKVVQTFPIKGAEDITISMEDGIAIISATKRQFHPPQGEEKGGLYALDLTSDIPEPKLLSASFDLPFAPHGISLLKKDSVLYIMAVSHTSRGHTLDLFSLSKGSFQHQATFDDPAIVHPNDVVLIDENRFYFTNDHRYVEGFGRFIEEYSGASWSNVIYFDGNEFLEVAGGIAYANGINYDRKRELLYVASPRKFLIKVYSVLEDGRLMFVEDIDCGTGVDNLELDQYGRIWTAAHPDLLHYTAYAKGKKEYSPSEVIRINYESNGNFDVKPVYVEDGSLLSASTVAAPYGNMVLVGSVLDDEFILLEGDYD